MTILYSQIFDLKSLKFALFICLKEMYYFFSLSYDNAKWLIVKIYSLDEIYQLLRRNHVRLNDILKAFGKVLLSNR